MVSLFSILGLISVIVLFSVVQGQGQSSADRLRTNCRSQQLGGICDLPPGQMCKYPQMASACQRENHDKDGEKPRPVGTTPSGTVPPATTPPAGTAPPGNHTRHPRRKHTTRVTAAPVTEKSQPTKGPLSKKFILSPEQIATIQVRVQYLDSHNSFISRWLFRVTARKRPADVKDSRPRLRQRKNKYQRQLFKI